MPVNYELMMGIEPMVALHDLTRRDTILYALGVGVGSERPTDPGELQYVYEDGLKSLPMMAVTLATPGFWTRKPEYGLTWHKIVHGEQYLEVFKPLPVEGKIRGITTVDEIVDKGPEKGALVYSSRRIEMADTGEHLATVSQAVFLRADGGFGGPSEPPRKPHPIPERAPDFTLRARTSVNHALIYRLSGDYNPLHIDPKVAEAAGFAGPIMHGLGSYSLVGRMLIKALCDDDPTRLTRLDVRFSNPVYPGETFVIEVWREGPDAAAFRVSVAERGVVVLQNGFAAFG
jgi:acyl dehydratase